ncbi:hypothetical protein ZIOFF_068436 [Zingiber officinale]|uniref:Uncharacterized protein n=1 Tax=Zingiber officinale TaxID=94328 RepID=A0A8J5EEN3_ZINOF|nr:hypothetical protein ZIOFF_068436 [Zingiber officinale]
MQTRTGSASFQCSFASSRSQASQRIGRSVSSAGRRWAAKEGTKGAPRTGDSPSTTPSGGTSSPARVSAPSCGTYPTFPSPQTLLSLSLSPHFAMIFRRFWVLYRAKQDGPVVLGWRHPWEGHGGHTHEH